MTNEIRKTAEKDLEICTLQGGVHVSIPLNIN
jgi:hypothetical protein